MIRMLHLKFAEDFQIFESVGTAPISGHLLTLERFSISLRKVDSEFVADDSYNNSISGYQANRMHWYTSIGTRLTKKLSLGDRYGGNMEEFPLSLRVCEFPEDRRFKMSA